MQPTSQKMRWYFGNPPQQARAPGPAKGMPGDHPISGPAGDLLGRTEEARRFAEQILATDYSEGAVLAVFGPWGAGKTSFLNLTREPLAPGCKAVIDFNPWNFSGTDQLVSLFFSELSAELRLDPSLTQIANKLSDYGERFGKLAPLLASLSPLTGAVARTLTVIGQALKSGRSEGVRELRFRLESSLRRLSRPIVVFLDDVDRLDGSEIRELFRLVRLTANLPNVVYLLALDRERVEGALDQEGLPGRAYLEKIVQASMNLPPPPEHVLSKQLLAALDAGLATVEGLGPIDEEVWASVFLGIVRPLVGNMRDVRRYVASVAGTARALRDRVALADLLGLDAIRIFLPDVFSRLHQLAGLLTAPSQLTGPNEKDSTEIKALIGVAAGRSEVARAMISHLFPAAKRFIGGPHYGPQWNSKWLKQRRVAAPEILALFLERTESSSLTAFRRAEGVLDVLSREEESEAFFRALPPESALEVIDALRDLDESFRPEMVVPGARVLLNLIPLLPSQRPGFLSIGAQPIVSAVVFRLLKVHQEIRPIEEEVRQVLSGVHSLSAKLLLIEMVGSKENVGHGLVSDQVAEKLALEWRETVRSTLPDLALSGEEYDLLDVLLTAKHESGPLEAPIIVPEGAEATIALLRSARSTRTSMKMGSPYERRTTLLRWEALVEVLGDERTVRERLHQVRMELPAAEPILLDIAEDYLKGFRPQALERPGLCESMVR